MRTITAVQMILQVQHPWIIIVKESNSDTAPEHRYRAEATQAQFSQFADKLKAFASEGTPIRYVVDDFGFLTDDPLPPDNSQPADTRGRGSAASAAGLANDQLSPYFDQMARTDADHAKRITALEERLTALENKRKR